MNTTINLSAELYNNFLRCLTNLKEICNDVDIRGGMIRQRSNDLTSVFEMDLTSIINDANMPITNMKKKLDNFKTFAGSSVTIDIVEGASESESYFSILDNESSLKIIFPAIEFMDNKLMTISELERIFNLDEEDLVLSNTLNNTITERIRIITFNFNTQAVQIKFDNDKASITTSTQAKDQFVKFKSDIPTNIDFNGKFSSNLSTIPFTIEHDEELDFKMYKVADQNVCMNVIKTKLGSVPVNIYSRSSLVEDN